MSSDPCRNSSCTFYGSPQFDGYCSQCRQQGSKPAADDQTTHPTIATTSSRTSLGRRRSSRLLNETTKKRPSSECITETTTTEGPSKKRKVNRCGICRKKVGLLGFDCRCGGLFCPLNRGDKDHNCQFDYKTLQRAELAEKNPRIVADKVTKI
eukprot:sb/3473358/